MSDLHPGFAEIVAVWNGARELPDLDELATEDYVGHIGSRTRDLARLKADITAYRAGAPGVVFRIEHQFDAGDELATRLTAYIPSPTAAGGTTLAGLNLSRWRDGRLVEEWAVWEQLEESGA